MALKATTGLETHPVGTAGLNSIINANWERLEAIFLPLATGAPDATIAWDATAKTFTVRAAQAAITYSATPAVNFTGAITQTLALTGNATLSTSNRAAGRKTTVAITSDGSILTLAFPAWKWIGAAAPASIAANKTGILKLTSTGTTDANVLAEWTVQA